MASNFGPFASILSSMPSMILAMLVLKLLDPPRRERRHQQAANAGVLRAVHLGDELRVHELVELLPARAPRHLRGERLGVGEHLVDVGVAADDHLRRALAEHIERRPLRPLGHVAMGVGLELGAAEIDVDDVAAVEFSAATTWQRSGRLVR